MSVALSSVNGEDRANPTKQIMTPIPIIIKGMTNVIFLIKKNNNKKNPIPNKPAPIKKIIKSM